MAEQGDMLPIDPAQADSLVGVDLAAVPESKWAPMLAQMVAVLEALYRRGGKDEDAAFRQACDSVMALADYWGGRVVYLPRGDRLKLALRDAEIYRRFRGSANADQLAEEFDLNVIRIYAIAAEQRALYVKRTQRELPLGERG